MYVVIRSVKLQKPGTIWLYWSQVLKKDRKKYGLEWCNLQKVVEIFFMVIAALQTLHQKQHSREVGLVCEERRGVSRYFLRSWKLLVGDGVCVYWGRGKKMRGWASLSGSLWFLTVSNQHSLCESNHSWILSKWEFTRQFFLLVDFVFFAQKSCKKKGILHKSREFQALKRTTITK